MTAGQKLNFQKSINTFAENKVQDGLQIAGRALPAIVVAQSGNMVTVRFSVKSDFTLPEITIPIFGPEYIRYPMQSGDRGVVLSMGVYIGEMSGQGGGVADLTTPQNLSALVYLPISNTEWQSVDPNVLTLYGPEGVTIRDKESNTTFLLTPTAVTIVTPDLFQVTVGGTSIRLTGTDWSISGVNGSLIDGGGETSPAIMGQAWAALKQWANNHTHQNDGSGPPNQQLNAEIVNP